MFKKVMTAGLLAGLLCFSACKKCVECQLVETCGTCRYAAGAEQDYCGNDAEFALFTSTCEDVGGTVINIQPDEVVEVRELCDKDKDTRQQFELNLVVQGYTCSNK